MTDSLVGKRITVMGLGTRGGGVGVARYLVEQGAIVTVTDMQPAEALAEPLRSLEGLPIRYVLGRHAEEDFAPAGADMVVRNPGVPRRAPLLALARRMGVPVEMEMSLFFPACPAPIVGITGTKGKTTTATLCAAMLRAWDDRTVLAGNMVGISALDQLKRTTPETPVVLELSSWQIEALVEHGLAPRIALVTNIAEDHLNHYDGFQDYAATKRSITLHQRPGDVLIVNADNPEAWLAAEKTAARVVPFGLADRGGDGAWLSDGRLVWRQAGAEIAVDLPSTPVFAGSHNAANALAAMTAALTRGAPPAAVAAGLRSFSGVKDRMELIAEIDGVTFINDTTATAPVAAVAALRSLPGRRIHLITGGADKRTDLAPIATAAAEHAHAVYLLEGSATPSLAALLAEKGLSPVGPFGSMEDAVSAVANAAAPGDVVLLSPGCASFGLFRDEFDRGEQFRQAVARQSVGADLRVCPSRGRVAASVSRTAERGADV